MSNYYDRHQRGDRALKSILLLGALLTAAVPATAAPAATRSCHLPGVEEALRCLALPVPLEPGKAATLDLHVTIAPALRQGARPDPLFVLAGGPGEYTGQPLDRVHAPMGITEADWTLGAQEIVRALNKNRVSKADQNELFALVEPLKPQIVQGHR